MENYLMINGKRTELTEEQLKQLGIEKQQKRWRAEEGDEFYFVNSYLEVIKRIECNNMGCDILYNARNYFKAEGQAEEYARVLETEMLLKKYADEHNKPMIWDGVCEHYEIYLEAGVDDICIATLTLSKSAGVIYFSSREIARNVLGQIGGERVIEYLKYEW